MRHTSLFLKQLSRSALLVMALAGVASGAEQVTQYELLVQVEPTKPSGKPWDAAGGAPDIMATVDGQLIGAMCQDNYTCKLTFTSNVTHWTITVQDRDMMEHDLIGYGACELNKECTLHQCRVLVR